MRAARIVRILLVFSLSLPVALAAQWLIIQLVPTSAWGTMNDYLYRAYNQAFGVPDDPYFPRTWLTMLAAVVVLPYSSLALALFMMFVPRRDGKRREPREFARVILTAGVVFPIMMYFGFRALHVLHCAGMPMVPPGVLQGAIFFMIAFGIPYVLAVLAASGQIEKRVRRGG